MMHLLPDDAFIMLDPSVEILDGRIGEEEQFLCHGRFEVGMIVPPGEGLVDFVSALQSKPALVGALRQGFDNQRLIDKILNSLYLHGFIHKTLQGAPRGEQLAALRDAARQRREQSLRQRIVVSLDEALSIERFWVWLSSCESTPEVMFVCRRLSEHGSILGDLAQRRKNGALNLYRTVIQTADLRADDDICESLLSLGASVTLQDVPWPAPNDPIPGLSELTQRCIAVRVLMRPDLSILEEPVRAYVSDWASSTYLSGICLQVETGVLWPSGDIEEDTFISFFEAVREVERKVGDVMIVDLPSDGVLLGKTLSTTCFEETSELADRFRLAYLRWRLPVLMSFEGDNTWSQTPEAEEKLIRTKEDFLPNHPELLQLRPGSFVVDVCGGLGRVARRLSPLVGPDGLVISIEMFRCVSDQARDLAGEGGFLNLDFRPGLAERIPLPDGTVDAAVNEWTGAIWELGMAPAMVKEMARVVRSGGRVAASHRLVRFPLSDLGEPWVQYEEIYDWMRAAFAIPELILAEERIWGQKASSLVGDNATSWRKQYLPRLVNPLDVIFECEEQGGPHADVFLTLIAQRQ